MRKFMKKLTSGIMAAAMVASLVVVAPAKKVEAATNLISNGTFNDESSLSDWKVSCEVSDVKKTVNNGNLVVYYDKAWADGDTAADVYITQDISSDKLETGKTYTFTAEIMGDGYDNAQAYVNGKSVGTVPDVVRYNSSNNWANVTYDIKITESDTVADCYTIGLYLKCYSGQKWNYIDNITLTEVADSDVNHSLDDLKALVNSIGDTSKYTKTSVAALESAKTEAQTLIDGKTTDIDKINAAYDALDDAIKGLVPADVINGDFSNAITNGWTADNNVVKVETKNENSYLNVWSENAGSYKISQTLTLDAGIYGFGVKNRGKKDTSSKSVITYKYEGNEAVSKNLADMTGWEEENWVETITDAFILDKETEVTLSITVTVDAGGCEQIDDVVLYRSTDMLQFLIDSVTDTSSYDASSVTEYKTAKTAAEAIIKRSKDNDNTLTDADIKTAYNALKTAIDNLDDPDADKYAGNNSKYATIEDANIYVKKIENLRDDFITGVDVSSFVAEYNSGVKYKDFAGNTLDEQGFFNFLADCGVNWVRIRVWNDPYDSNSNGYGGGNCDLDTAEKIGKWASNAGMKVLIDFHYSDFWTDPSKQMAPKEWKNMDIDTKAAALEKYTTDSLNTLIKAGVYVGMVQIGNETNNGICGETTKNWNNMGKIFKAGSEGVRAVDKNILIAVHLADPDATTFSNYAENLDEQEVDYDVFASSYYPYFHGTIENLTKALKAVADTYNKKVMVAETTYLSTWEDGDGHDNSRREGTKSANDFDYDVSVQGQAHEFREVANAVASIKLNAGQSTQKTLGIGVFSWEPAWIPVKSLAGKSDAEKASIKASNSEKWERYGSGWASSYAGEYDPNDAGKWYGGSAIDNEAIFDFDGKALESAKMYKYIRYGTKTDNHDEVLSVVSQQKKSVMTSLNDVPTSGISTTATVFTRDYDQNKTAAVKWDESAIEKAVKEIGTYEIPGTAEYGSKSYDVTFTLDVKPDNYLSNYSFEELNSKNLPDNWTLTGDTSAINCVNTDNNVQNGTHSVKFWAAAAFKFTGEQAVELKRGVYVYGGYVEGGYGEGSNADTNIFRVYTKIGDEEKIYSESAELGGFLNFTAVEVPEFVITADDTTVICGFETDAASETWGCWDDMYLNKVSTDEEDKAASDVETLINAIGDVTKDKAEQIKAARAAYDALTDIAKKMVTNLDVLEDAEEELSELVPEETPSVEEPSELVPEEVPPVEEPSKEKPSEETPAVVAPSTETPSTDAPSVNSQVIVPAAVGVEITSSSTGDTSTYKVTSSEPSNPTVEYEGTKDTSAKNVSIPDTVTDANGVTYVVTKIADDALKGNKKVTTVTIGENITEIGKNAFKNCTSLKKIVVKGTVIEKIDEGAFSGDKALTSIDLSGSTVKTIGKKAFSGCKKLKTIKLNGNSLKTVSKGAFKNIKKNATITILAKNKNTYNKVVKKIKKSGAKNVKYKFKKKK